MNVASACVSALINVYRLGISPILPGSCRFQPSCSTYARDAVLRFGAARGGVLALRRLVRCHPLGGWGYDPVPERTTSGAPADCNASRRSKHTAA